MELDMQIKNGQPDRLEDIRLQVRQLNELAMVYETSVQLLPAEDYLTCFYDGYEIKNRAQNLVPAEGSFEETLREVSGYDVWQPIAAKTRELFGAPERVMVFDDTSVLREELEGPEGLAIFYFVFDLLFCEYEDFTLCFLSGSNN